eukprot:363433-Chlamydomonas_euryale.AAC.15
MVSCLKSARKGGFCGLARTFRDDWLSWPSGSCFWVAAAGPLAAASGWIVVQQKLPPRHSGAPGCCISSSLCATMPSTGRTASQRNSTRRTQSTLDHNRALSHGHIAIDTVHSCAANPAAGKSGGETTQQAAKRDKAAGDEEGQSCRRQGGIKLQAAGRDKAAGGREGQSCRRQRGIKLQAAGKDKAAGSKDRQRGSKCGITLIGRARAECSTCALHAATTHCKVGV